MATIRCSFARAALPLGHKYKLSCVSFVVHRAKLSMFKKPFFDNEPSVSYLKTLFAHALATDLVQPLYSKGSPEREAITKSISSLKSKLPVKIPLAIAGKSVRLYSTGNFEANLHSPSSTNLSDS